MMKRISFNGVCLDCNVFVIAINVVILYTDFKRQSIAFSIGCMEGLSNLDKFLDLIG